MTFLHFRLGAALCLALLTASTLPAWAQPSQTVPDTLAQRLVACTSCHARVDARGNPVNDAYYPRIGGKPAGYLYNQLLNFREGRRQYPLMTYLVDHLPDPYLREIAGWFAAQHPPAPQPAPGSMPLQTLGPNNATTSNMIPTWASATECPQTCTMASGAALMTTPSSA